MLGNFVNNVSVNDVSDDGTICTAGTAGDSYSGGTTSRGAACAGRYLPWSSKCATVFNTRCALLYLRVYWGRL